MAVGGLVLECVEQIFPPTSGLPARPVRRRRVERRVGGHGRHVGGEPVEIDEVAVLGEVRPLADRIAFSKGPYFAENGDFASVGTARIAYLNRLAANIATVTAGSFNYVRTLLAGSPEVGRGNLLYAFEYQTTNGPWEVPENFGKYNGVLRYAEGTATNGFNITAMAYKADWSATDQIPLRAVNSGLLSRFGTIDPTDGGNSRRYSLSGQWAQSEGEISRTASLYVARSSLDLYSNFTYFLDNPVNGDQFNQSETRTFYGGELAQTWFSALGRAPRVQHGRRAGAAGSPQAGGAVSHRGPRSGSASCARTASPWATCRRTCRTASSGPTGSAPSRACAPTSTASTCRATST